MLNKIPEGAFKFSEIDRVFFPQVNINKDGLQSLKEEDIKENKQRNQQISVSKSLDSIPEQRQPQEN